MKLQIIVHKNYLILFSAFLIMAIGGCSSSEKAVEAPAEPDENTETAPYNLFENIDGRLVMTTGDSGARIHIGRGGRMGFASMAPTADAWAFALIRRDSSRLYLFDAPTGRVSLLHSGRADLSYSGAWTADGTWFAFGYYRRSGDEMGPGAIYRTEAGTGTARNVGCTASKIVLGWRPDGSLIVRNDENLYHVAAEGCETIASIDARKMYYATPSPNGDRLAFVLRDLVYNREERAYEPDSTLYVRGWGDSEPNKIIGDRYSPRFPVWSPDGSELAYDVRLPDAPGVRSVSIYSLETGRSSYLVPPDEAAPSREEPIWSPGGHYLLYSVDSEAGSESLRYRPFAESFTKSVPLENIGGSIRTLAWAGNHHLVVSGENGETMLYDLRTGSVLESGSNLVFAVWNSG